MKRSELLTDVSGIVVVTLALLVYGVLQERIMTVGDSHAHRTHARMQRLIRCL